MDRKRKIVRKTRLTKVGYRKKWTLRDHLLKQRRRA